MNHRLANLIKELHQRYPDMGYRRLRDMLEHEYHISVNDKRVLRICRKLKIQSIVKNPHNCCTRPAVDPAYIAENILNREFDADRPDQKWVTDVSEFKYGQDGDHLHKLYLSVILDLYGRIPVATVISDHNGYQLSIDTERGLFSIGTGKAGGMVLRFADLTDYELNFKPEEVKEGLLGDKVKGNEFVMVELATPKLYLEDIINYGVKLRLRKKGILSTKYEYELSDGFMEAIRAFTICVYIELQRREGTYNQESQNIGEIEKALALFIMKITLQSNSIKRTFLGV